MEPSTKSGEHKSQFKIIVDKRESLLSNAGNPAGWVNRTTDREEMAVHGSEWRSDAEFLLLFIDFLLERLDLYFRFNIVRFFFLFSFGNLVGVFSNTFSF